MPLIGIVAMAQIPLILLDSLVGANEITFTEISLSTIIGVVQYVVLAILSVFAIIFMTGASVHAISRHVEGSDINVDRAYEVAWQKLRPLGGTGFLVAFALMGMALTIIGIPLAIYFAVRWAFAVPAAMLETTGPRDSMSHSTKLVRGDWLRVAAVLGLLSLIWAFAGSLLSGAVSLILGLGLGAVINDQAIVNQVVGVVGGLAWVVVTPLMLIGLTLVYWDLRVRKEGIDKETIADELDYISAEDLGSGFELAAVESSKELVKVIDGTPGRASNRFARNKRRHELEQRIRALHWRCAWRVRIAVSPGAVAGAGRVRVSPGGWVPV